MLPERKLDSNTRCFSWTMITFLLILLFSVTMGVLYIISDSFSLDSAINNWGFIAIFADILLSGTYLIIALIGRQTPGYNKRIFIIGLIFSPIVVAFNITGIVLKSSNALILATLIPPIVLSTVGFFVNLVRCCSTKKKTKTPLLAENENLNFGKLDSEKNGKVEKQDQEQFQINILEEIPKEESEPSFIKEDSFISLRYLANGAEAIIEPFTTITDDGHVTWKNTHFIVFINSCGTLA